MRHVFGIATALVMAVAHPAMAAPSSTPGGDTHGLEAILFEAPGCRYCELFRRDVLPTYESTPHGRRAPLRFLDVNAPAARRLGLSRPVHIVPTVVLVKDGVEVGRIDGYVGRQSFHRLLDALLRAE